VFDGNNFCCSIEWVGKVVTLLFCFVKWVGKGISHNFLFGLRDERLDGVIWSPLCYDDENTPIT
jgi:hypothetical protein